MNHRRSTSSLAARVSLVAGLLIVGGVGLTGFLRLTEHGSSRSESAASPDPQSVPSPRPNDTPSETVNAAFDVPPPAEPAPEVENPPKAEQSSRFKEDSLSLESRLRRAQEHDELNARLAPERVDPTWTASVERRMQTLLADGGISSRALESVDCRETICRLRLASESDRQQAVMALIHSARALHPETWLLPESDERGSKYYMDVFLPRDGYRLSSGGGRVDSPLAIGEAPPIAQPAE